MLLRTTRVLDSLGGEELLDEGRIDNRSSSHDPLQRPGELVHVRDAALDQVTDPLTAGQEFGRLLDLHVRGQHHDRRLRKLLADGRGGVEAFRRVSGRHPDVDDREVGTHLPDQLDQLGGAPASPTTSKPSGPQARQSLAEENVVVGNHDPRAACAHSIDCGVA